MADMRNFQLSSRETDRKVLFAGSIILVLAFSALAGYLMPTPLEDARGRLVGALVGLLSALLVWSVFQFLRPARGGQTWTIAEIIGMPILWLLIVAGLALWIHHSNTVFTQELERLPSPVNVL